jgi:transposase InsO family protein
VWICDHLGVSKDHRDWPNSLKTEATTRLNQVWAAGMSFIEQGREFVYLAVIIDVFSRGIRGWYLDRDLSSELAHRALDQTLSRHDLRR